ncbi:MAG: amino acid ABC transporter permease, partial [Planctomycetota bacterium]|nr:amino acid ABC transporter permease [Planctomycetota bacterium]
MDFQITYNLFASHYPVFAKGLLNSFLALLVGMALATALGLICSLIINRNKGVLNRVIRTYITIIRNTPFLVQLYLIYFGLPSFGIILSAFETGALALMLNSGAYIADILKAGFQAVEQGQIEAAEALGLTGFQRFRLVVVPQSLPQIIPAITGQYLIMFQDTSLMSIIAYPELTRSITDVGNETYMFLEGYIIGGV